MSQAATDTGDSVLEGVLQVLWVLWVLQVRPEVLWVLQVLWVPSAWWDSFRISAG
jgi:hypothetical protein